jgi:hypothetical protein
MTIPFDKLLSDVNAVILCAQCLDILLYERTHARVLAEILNINPKHSKNVNSIRSTV